MMGARPRIFGIVNLTEDSFSDGGRYLEPGAALCHAHTLVDEGADVIELGPSSTHPDARPVSPADEIRRLEPVFAGLEGSGIPLAVDAFQPETQRWALAHGADWLNDTQGFPEPAAIPELASSSCELVVMHSVQRRGGSDRRDTEPRRLLAEIESFFAERVQALVEAGVSKERLVLDPGMGFFLGSRPESSLAVLRELPGLRARFGLRLLVSVSRKSFLQQLAGRSALGSGAASLAAELYAASRGVDFIRTHAPGPLRDALAVQRALLAAPSS